MPHKEGRNWVFSEEEIIQVGALASVLNIQQIGEYFGISGRTFDRQLKNEPKVRKAYDEGRNKAIATVGKGLLKKALDGNLTAMIFYLKTQAGWREKESLELTGKDGGPIETKELTDDPVGVLSRRILGIAARIRATEIIQEPERDGSKLLPP